ncbi:MAG: MCP four helix bundle domain-containing protein [Sterolibacterium sp.]|jgi:methyl-accepting chemotaxis protein|nr:MCP four helix bundle domain-containing protein [Sterolibacterium sp.]
MSIGKRLAILVIVTLLALVGSGLYGVLQLKGLQSHFNEVNERSVPSLMAMGRVNDQFKEARALLLALLMEDDPDLRKAFAQKITETKGSLKNAAAAFNQIPGAEEAAKAMTPIAEGYDKAIDDVLAVADKKDMAQLALYTKVVPAEKTFSTFLEKSQLQLVENQKRLREQVATSSSRSISVYVVVLVTAALLVAFMGIMLHRSVMGSLNEMTRAMKNAATNLDFRQRVEVKSQDEVGVAVQAFNSLLDTVQASLREIAGSMATLSAATSRLTHTTQEIQSISEKTSESSSTVSSTVQQVTVSINHVASQTEQAEALARESGHQASAGGEVIQDTIEQIRSIAGTVHSAAEGINELRSQITSISSVVNVIREVADQTNLLALNAAIEAARAGEQGRGFAVVADEVRKLAERTATSTQEISTLIHAIQQSATAAVDTMQVVVEKVEDGVGNASTAINALSGIRASSDKVVFTVSEIAAAIREQSTATSYISEQFQRIANISEEARKTVSDTSQSTQELEQLAIRVNDAVKRYRI